MKIMKVYTNYTAHSTTTSENDQYPMKEYSTHTNTHARTHAHWQLNTANCSSHGLDLQQPCLDRFGCQSWWEPHNAAQQAVIKIF